MPIAPLLAAGFADFVEALVILAIIIISAVAKFIGQRQQAQPPIARPRLPEPDAPPPVDELDDFIRRAAERRAAQAPDPVHAQTAKPAQKPIPTQKPSDQQPIHAKVVPTEPAEEQVADHVQKHLAQDEFVRRRKEFGQQVASADRQINQHLHQVFDHKLGRITVAPDSEAAKSAATANQEKSNIHDDSAVPTPTFATDIASLLTEPASIRQAVILSEILNRPKW